MGNDISQSENPSGVTGSSVNELKSEISRLKKQNHALVKRSLDLADIKRELEDKYNELESTQKELKSQNIKLIKKSVELSDVMRQLEDKNYDLRQLQVTLEDLVVGRTAQLRETNKKLRAEIRGKSETQEALRKSEESYRVVFENTGTAIFMIEKDLTISMMNARAAEMTGYLKSDVEGSMKWTELAADPVDEKVMGAYQAGWGEEGKGSPAEHEFNLRSRSGEVKKVIAYIDTIQGTGKSIASMIDVTQRIQAEEEKRELEAHLRQAHKMEAIGTLAGGIAHDFNNILAAVTGYVEMALNNSPDDTPIPRWLGQALKACQRAKELVNQILTFSRRKEQEMKPVQIGLIVKEVLRFMRASLPSTIRIRHNIMDSQDVIMGDPTQLHQILMNLCTNAAHAMNEHGGELTVALETRAVGKGEAGNTAMTPGSYVWLTVKDTGHGIPQDIIEKIFDPFFTTKKPGEGTGMGLALAHGIVEGLGGTIEVESETGIGTEFRLSFPVVDEKEERRIDHDVSLPEGNERILLVDDDSEVLLMLKEMIEECGYRVTPVNDSRRALELFQSSPDYFDLVVTDQTMPDITGFELAVSLLDIRPELPVVLCTGFSEKVTREGAMDIGVREFLSKPVRRKTLASAIRKALDGGE